MATYQEHLAQDRADYSELCSLLGAVQRAGRQTRKQQARGRELVQAINHGRAGGYTVWAWDAVTARYAVVDDAA